jgi:peptidylprolyl isomerase
MPTGVKVEEITLGTGALAERGTVVTLHYRGFLHRGDQFRNSYDDGRPLRVHLGRREVIAGLERGIFGMRVGDRRRLVISPHLAYGAAGVPGVIPPNAVVIVEVELLDVQSPTTTI